MSSLGTSSSRNARRRGFTLTELAVATTVSALVIAGSVRLFVSQRITFSALKEVNTMNQSLRVAMDMVASDIRSAGYGLPKADIKSWVTWVAGVTGAVTVVQGPSGSADAVHLVGAFDGPTASIAANATRGDTTLLLKPGQGALFDTTKKKVIYLDSSETARITAVNGDQLTISTSPTANAGLRGNYTTNATVELVKVLTYSWRDSLTAAPKDQFLKRWDNLSATGADWQQMLAGNIEDFQIASSGKTFNVSISIVGRKTNPDPMYVDPTKGDHYRRTTCEVDVRSRQP